MVALAAQAGPVGVFVVIVLGGCRPSQVGETVVRAIAVSVRPLCAGRAWGDKGLQDESMDEALSPLSAVAWVKRDFLVPARAAPWGKDAPF
jgi:hypothetical protein